MEIYKGLINKTNMYILRTQRKNIDKVNLLSIKSKKILFVGKYLLILMYTSYVYVLYY